MMRCDKCGLDCGYLESVTWRRPGATEWSTQQHCRECFLLLWDDLNDGLAEIRLPVTCGSRLEKATITTTEEEQ